MNRKEIEVLNQMLDCIYINFNNIKVRFKAEIDITSPFYDGEIHEIFKHNEDFIAQTRSNINKLGVVKE